MNHKTILINLLLFVCLLFCGCEKWMEDHLGRTIVCFKNNAEYGISVYSAMTPPYDPSSPIYPDTSLPIQLPSVIDISSHDYRVIIDTRDELSEIYTEFQTDTMSFFFLSTEQLSSRNWDYIRTSYKILQRYDISRDDFLSIKQYPVFPPSEEMRNIKMWPPYGTYDANGNRVK